MPVLRATVEINDKMLADDTYSKLHGARSQLETELVMQLARQLVDRRLIRFSVLDANYGMTKLYQATLVVGEEHVVTHKVEINDSSIS